MWMDVVPWRVCSVQFRRENWRKYLSTDERDDVHLSGVRVLDGGNDEAGST